MLVKFFFEQTAYSGMYFLFSFDLKKERLMTKTIVSLLILLTLFSFNVFAADYPRLKVILPGHQEGISSLSFSPDGSTLANTGWKKVFLWDVASRQLKATLTPDTQLSSNVAFSPDGSILASSGSGNNDKKIYLWDVASRQLKSTLTGHRAGVNSIAFSPNGSTLASGGGYKDHTVRLWDVVSSQTKTIFTEHTAGVNSVAFSPDGSTLASGSYDGTVRLWDVASRQLKAILTGYAEEVWSVAFSPDGNILASCGRSGRYNDKKVYLWDVASRQLKATLIGHTERVHSIAFSPDGRILASGSRDGTVRLWDIASGQFKAILSGFAGEANSIAFSPDGRILASGGWNGDSSIRLWDLTASATTPAVVSVSPAVKQSLAIGEQLTISLNIAGGENVTGYQATVVFDPDALIYFSSTNGDYLSDRAFFTVPDVAKNYVTLASAGTEGKNGDGTLATITFQVLDTKASGLFLSQVHLVDPNGERLFPYIENGIATDGTEDNSTAIEPVYIAEDINEDGVVNIQDLVLVSSNFGKTGENEADINGDGIVDIVDLVKVAAALGNAAEAPSIHPQTLTMLTAADVQGWLTQAQHLNLTDIASQRGIRILEQLLTVLTPEKTVLLPNYPNPFNPETWIPYQLANPSDVQIIIYDTRGIAIRHLALGHQQAGYYTTRDHAAYWDGRNDLGERVATGVYFYQLQADDMSLLRKMVILK